MLDLFIKQTEEGRDPYYISITCDLREPVVFSVLWHKDLYFSECNAFIFSCRMASFLVERDLWGAAGRRQWAGPWRPVDSELQLHPGRHTHHRGEEEGLEDFLPLCLWKVCIFYIIYIYKYTHVLQQKLNSRWNKKLKWL